MLGFELLLPASGFAILGERMSPSEWLAIACIVVASVGGTMTTHRRRTAAAPALPA